MVVTLLHPDWLHFGRQVRQGGRRMADRSASMVSLVGGADPVSAGLAGLACYCPGTLILTAAGDVPVEQLQIGNQVVTLSGLVRPIRWLGRRSYDERFMRGRRDIVPVCIHAGALGEDLPRRDLFVSPKHALLLEGVLVPAGCLVNGVSITQAEDGRAVYYIHVELTRHDVIFAEGAAAETFIDDNSRGVFQNAHEFAYRYPKRKRLPAVFCAPRVTAGDALDGIKRTIDLRAGLVVADVPDRALVLGDAD